MTGQPTVVPPPIFQVFSIAFRGQDVLPMRDLVTDLVIGATPEWVLNRRSAPVALPQGSIATLTVVFQASNVDQFPSGQYTIGATGAAISVKPRTVPVAIQPQPGFSKPIKFAFDAPIPAGIGGRAVTLDWRATDRHGTTISLGQSTHEFYVTWRALPASTKGVRPAKAPYQALVQMAVRWCAGQTTLEGICGALVHSMNQAGLSPSILGGDVRLALLMRQTDSAGFAAILEQMLIAHGIPSVTRTFVVNWAALPSA